MIVRAKVFKVARQAAAGVALLALCWWIHSLVSRGAWDVLQLLMTTLVALRALVLSIQLRRAEAKTAEEARRRKRAEAAAVEAETQRERIHEEMIASSARAGELVIELEAARRLIKAYAAAPGVES